VEDVSTLSRLVDDLQELSVAEAGRLRYDQTIIDLREIVQAEVERAGVIAPAAVSVTTRLPEQLVKVYADEFRIGQVVRNLLSNALRHTAEGSVTVTVELLDEAHARVSVADTGEGIPVQDLAHIWERFYRVDARVRRARAARGWGLRSRGGSSRTMAAVCSPAVRRGRGVRWGSTSRARKAHQRRAKVVHALRSVRSARRAPAGGGRYRSSRLPPHAATPRPHPGS